MKARFLSINTLFIVCQFFCAFAGILCYIANSTNFLASSTIPKIVLSFLGFWALLSILLPFFKKDLHKTLFRNYVSLFNNKYISLGLILLLFIIVTIIFSAPEGIKTIEKPIYTRLEPVLIFLLFQCFCFLLIKTLLEVSKNTGKNFIEYSEEHYFIYIIPFAILVWPFLFYWPRTIPINGSFTGIGNDFIPITYSHRLMLLDYLAKWKIPLWSPGEGAGFPFYSSPHTQTFYPLNVLSTLSYKLNGGYSVLDHQRYTILGIMIFGLGIYFYLKQLKINNLAVIITALILPCTFKIAELQRYSLATHSVAWYPWILLGLTILFTENSIKMRFLSCLLLSFSLYSLFTAGYPYYSYYLIFLIPPYFLCLFVSINHNGFFKHKVIINLRNVLVSIIASLVPLGIAGPYLLKVSQLMQQTSGRSNNSMEFATEHAFTPMDTLGSFIFPPAAQAEGWFYFGIILFFLLGWFIIITIRKLIFDRNHLNDSNVLCFFILSISVILVCLVTYGKESLLFVFLWKYLPLFSSLRTWGRLNVVLIMLLAPIIAVSIESFWHFISEKDTFSSGKKSSIIIFCVEFLVVISLQTIIISRRAYDPYWSRFFFKQSGHESMFLLASIASFIFLMVIVLNFQKKNHLILRSFYPLLFLLSVIDLWPVASTMWPGTDFKTVDDKRYILNMAERIIPESLSYPRNGELMAADVALKPRFFVGYANDWYLNRYKTFYVPHEYEKNFRSELLGITRTERFFFSTRIDHIKISDFLKDSKNFGGEISILRYSGDYAGLSINSKQNGWISFIDNWDPDWKVFVNHKEVPMSLLFGTFKSVNINSGSSIVEFIYKPEIPSFSSIFTSGPEQINSQNSFK